MGVSDSFVTFVVDQLADCGLVTPQRMFGGVGLYSGDLFFGLLANGLMYLKADDTNRRDFEAAGMGPFRPYGDQGETMLYYQVPVEVLENADELSRWARKAMTVASAARLRKQKRRQA